MQQRRQARRQGGGAGTIVDTRRRYTVDDWLDSPDNGVSTEPVEGVPDVAIEDPSPAEPPRTGAPGLCYDAAGVTNTSASSAKVAWANACWLVSRSSRPVATSRTASPGGPTTAT